MLTKEQIKNNINQIIAIANKNFKMSIRYKFDLVLTYITPIISFIFPIIIMGTLFSFQDNFGPWTAKNYLIYLFIGYIVSLIERVISGLSSKFLQEKYMLTLQAIMVAPFNRFNLLLGYILSHIIEVFIPFSLFLVLCYILFPISPLTLIMILILMGCLLLSFSGIGFIIAVYNIANENIAQLLKFSFSMLMMFSCLSFPYEIFPSYVQFIVNKNPIYYLFDIIRLTWVENDVVFTITNHPIHLIILIIFVLGLPIFGVYMFNYIFKKHGIAGY